MYQTYRATMADASAKGNDGSDAILYYHPASFYSQRVLLALYEKGVSFERRLINIFTGEQNDRWYVKINPKAAVPVLKLGDNVINESSEIVDYVDKSNPSNIVLVPDVTSNKGKLVQKFRQLFDDVIMEVVTYGVVYHPDLPHVTRDSIKLPAETQLKMKETIASDVAPTTDAKRLTKNVFHEGNHVQRIARLKELADGDASQRADFLAKHKRVTGMHEAIKDRNQVQKHLDNVEKICITINEQLRSANEGQTEETWITGTGFTAADINFAIFLNRVLNIGLNFVIDKNQHIKRFREQILKRASFQKLLEECEF